MSSTTTPSEKLHILALSRWEIQCGIVERPFSGKLGRKIQNCSFKVKCVSMSNSNVQNSMVMLTFFVLDRKYPY